MVRIARKPKPFKRFQRYHVDSLWQMDVYAFRISGVGKVYVITILDDRSRYLVMARAYSRQRAKEAVNCLWWAMKAGRKPKAIYVDNGTCFISKEFKRFCANRQVNVIYGRPYHPQGRGKLERFHRILTQELIGQVRFRSLTHFRREVWLYRRQYNKNRPHGGIDWKTPAEVYRDPSLKNKGAM
jgi:transposase InsO family protein